MAHNKNTEPTTTTLGSAATAAVAVLADLGPAERRTALRALGYAEARRVWTPRVIGEWPTLTEHVAERDRDAIYASEAWRLGYRRTTTIIVYLLQAVGLAHLSALLGGLSLAKVGTTLLGNFARRIADLNSCEYGAWVRGPHRYVHAPGFDDYQQAIRLQLAVQSPPSPIRLCAHGLEVDLPVGFSADEFEAQLNNALRPLRLERIVDSEAGRALCHQKRVEPSQFRRFYKKNGGYCAATELTLFRPQADIGALARACEDIVIDRVIGLHTRRPLR